MKDVLIVGGGAIGLALAWKLAERGKSVQLIDRGLPGREASWAGAGILPPATLRAEDHPAEQLRGLACQLHPQWAAELQRLTGIDIGYRRSGGLYLARLPGEAAALAAWAGSLAEEGVRAERLSAADLYELEPGLRPTADSRLPIPDPRHATPVLLSAWLLPDEAQLRNPRYLQALVAACERAGVTITPNVETADFVTRDGHLSEIATTAGPLAARQFCFTAGAWTGVLLQRLAIEIGIVPIRGQIVLFKCDGTAGQASSGTLGMVSSSAPIHRIVNEGSRYLVPRDDGYVLAGATEEEAGFDKRNTEEAIADLTAFARGLVPALRDAKIERTWAGLRPGSFDGLPYLGKLPGLANAFVAAGHFRTGLYLSPATAIVMSDLICGDQPRIDLSPLRVGR